ncbi:MAG: hypothetical protein IT260_18665 [Saprospiraceae bacterium]|nr:hypothetical protein [Saprospiraceae bacterium]
MNKAVRLYNLLLCLGVLLLATGLRAQTPADTLSFVRSLPLQAQLATADNLGYLYLLSEKNAVEKYGPDGRLLARYTNNRLGRLSTLDVSNPMKVLLWYADFRTLVLLDRNLTALGELNLIRAGFPEVNVVAPASDGQLWIYDEVDFQLRKITAAGEILFESQALNQLQARRISLCAIHDNGHEVLASDTANGILWFDVYGQFQKQLPWPGIQAFTLGNNQLAYLSDTTLHLEQLYTLASRQLPLPEPARLPGARCWLAPGGLLIQEKEGLSIWQWPKSN